MKKLLLILSLTSVTHCSLLELLPGRQGAFVSPAVTTDSETTTSRTETVAALSAPPSTIAAQPSSDDIEVLWEIPKSEVDGYLIFYGFTESEQTNQIRLKTAELEKFNHPKRGPLYRWVLRELPSNKPLYVSLAAYKGDQLSARTKILQVVPRQ